MLYIEFLKTNRMRFKNVLFLLTTKTRQNNTISLFKKLERSISQRKTINFEIDTIRISGFQQKSTAHFDTIRDAPSWKNIHLIFLK